MQQDLRKTEKGSEKHIRDIQRGRILREEINKQRIERESSK